MICSPCARTAIVCAACFAVPGVGLRELLRQLCAARWILGVTAAGQLLFLGPEEALANTVRVAATVALCGLLALTTPVSTLLEALERALRPLALLRLDHRRAALVLTVALSTLPVLAGLARQNAKGLSGGETASPLSGVTVETLCSP